MIKSKLTGVAVVLVFLVVIFIGCRHDGGDNNSGDVKVTGISMSASDGSNSGESVIYLGGTTAQIPASLSFTATVTPPNASNKDLTWTVTPDTYVDWDADTRTVTARALGGPTTVTVKTVDGGFTKVWTVTVEDPANRVAVTGVQIVYSGASLVFEKTGNGFTPASIPLGHKVLPENATNKSVNWSVEPVGVVTVVSGTVTPVGLGNAVITLASVDNTNATETINVSVTEEETIPPSLYELKLVNQSSSPADGTTLLLPERDAVTKRYTVANTFNSFSAPSATNPDNPWSGAGWAAGNATTGVMGTTVVYLDKALGNNASISARVRITQVFGSTANTGGLIFGMFSNPAGTSNIQFSGIRAGTDGTIAMYCTRDSSGISNSATQFSTALTGLMDDEYIFTITRTGATAYSLKVDDANGTNLRSGTRSGASQIIDLGNVYPGFIIARATVEISQITVTEGTEADNIIYQSGTSAPAVYPVESIEFIVPAVDSTATAGEYECGHSTKNGDLTITVNVLPARATDKTVTWNVVSGPATLSASTGDSVTASFTAETGTVVITASAGGKSLKLTIDVSAGSIPVKGITISAAGGKTSITAGNGTVQPETLKFTELIDPPSATDPEVTWSLSEDSTYANTTTVKDCAISASGLLTAPANYTGADFTIYVFAKAVNDGGNAVSTGIPITVKKYVAPIFQFKPGDATFTNASTARIINGISAVRTGGNFSADTTGITMAATSSRWVLGYSAGTLSSTGASGNTTATAYITNGELNLNRKFSVTIEYTTATSGALYVYLQNNDTNNSTSVFGTGSLQQTNTTTPSGSFTVTFDPSTLTLNTGVSGVTKEAILEKSFLQFRAAQIITFTSIVIREVE